MLKECTIDEFIEALYNLDKKLVEDNLNIEIRAIGGFAMLYYGIRKNGYTIDIDTLTESYDNRINGLIKEVGKELNIDEDWLNNDCAYLEGFMDELKDEINWIKPEYSFKQINLKVADLKGLIRSKAKAVHDGGLVPRSTDKKDLMDALRAQGINDVNELNVDSEYSFIEKCYPRSYEFLCKENSW